MEMIRALAISLVLTFLLELFVAWIMGIRTRESIILILLVNILTNPAAVYLSYLLAELNPAVNPLVLQVPVEIVVLFAEAFIYKTFSKHEEYSLKRPILYAFAANAFSWGIGVILNFI